MSKPLTFVRLDIARFGLEISEHRTDEALAEWVRSLHRALVLSDPTMNEYAATMLSESEGFREKCGNASRAYWEGKRKGKGTIKAPNTRTEQSRAKNTLPDANASRPRNELFDAIVHNFFSGGLAKSDGARIGKMAATLKERGATPEQVKAKKEAYMRLHPTWDVTPEAVIKHWPNLMERYEKPNMTEEEKLREWRRVNVI